MNSEDCAQARNILTNPRKRLSAEIAWFPGVSPQKVDLIIKYVIALKEQSENAKLDIEKFGSNARLNILKETLRYHQINDSDGLVALILAIDDTFENIDVNGLRIDINEDRVVSGFAPIGDLIQVEDEFKQVRLDIQKLIDGIFATLPQEKYIEILTFIAELCLNKDEPEFRAILNDLLESYRVTTKDLIEREATNLLALTENIQSETGEVELIFMVDHLIQKVENFDRIAQPLQIKSRADGTKHQESERVAWAIRNLAVELHNNHNATEQSMKLVELIKITFAELDEFAEKAEEDIAALKDIIQNQKEEKAEHGKMLAENLSDRRYSVTVLGDRFAIPPFCTCCMMPTDNLEEIRGSISETRWRTERTRTVILEFPICSNCKKHRKQISIKRWILTILSLVVSFIGFVFFCFTELDYNTVAMIYAVISAVIYFVIGYLMKLPQISPEHSTWEESTKIKPMSMSGTGIIFEFTNWKYANLFADANEAECAVNKNRSRVKNNRLIFALEHPILVYILILSIALAVMLYVGPSIYQSVTSNQNAGASEESSLDVTPSNYQQIDNIKKDLEMRSSRIKNMEADLSNMEDDLEYFEDLFDSTHDNTYADEYNSILDDYQDLYNEYDSAINKYNEIVDDYNALNGH